MATPTLPIILPAGFIAVYGQGTSGIMPSGAVTPANVLFGSVYNIWAGGQTYVYGGDVVYWQDDKNIVRLATAGGTFTLLPARLVTKDNTEIT